MDLPLPPLLKPEGVSTDHRWLNIPTERLSTYNSWDIYTTARLRRIQEHDLEKNGQLEFYREWFRIVPVAIRMQQRGFGQVDFEKRDALKLELEKELYEAQQEVLAKCTIFDRMAREAEEWRETNAREHPTWGKKLEKGYASRLRKIERAREKFWGKSKLLREFVFDELGIKPAPKTRDRPARSLGIEALLVIMEKFRKKDEVHRDTLESLIHIAKLNTVLDRYMNPPTRNGRLYPTLRLYAAESLRWSYIRPALHQWTPRMRTIVHARPGYVFVGRDFSQIELGINAFLAGDRAQVEAFLDPARDMHIETAMDSLGMTFGAWKALEKDYAKALRNVFKSTGYRRNYGGEGGKTAENTKVCPCRRCRKEEDTGQGKPLTAAQMKQADLRWRTKHPRILDFREGLLNHVQNNGNSWTSPFGYVRVWCGPLDAIKRSVYNFPCQHGVAEIIRRKMIILEERLKELHRPGEDDWGMVLQMHDEIIVECPADRADEVNALMKEVMESPVEQIRWQGRPVCFPTDGKIAEWWGDLK